MFVAELFEDHSSITKTVVVIPGGFHPMHPGHVSLYQKVVQQMPQADVYMAATNDQSERPFPFAVKHQLAVIAGIPADRFVQVKSPFNPREITSNYDAETTALVIVRSEKDRNEPPVAGGTKKDGSPSYLQPVTQKLKPMSQHGYMAYLPTIEFKAGPQGMTSATQIRTAWPNSSPEIKAQIISDMYPKIAGNAQLIQRAIGIFDQVMGGLAEGWKSKLAGAALAGAAAFGGGAQAQAAPPAGVNATGTNAAIVQSLVNPVAQQRFAKMHADTTAKLTDPRYTHNPNALAQHQAAPQQQHAEMLQNIKNIEQWDNPYRIIQMAMNMAGVTPQEVLQNLPKGYKLPTTEPKGTFVPKDLGKLSVNETLKRVNGKWALVSKSTGRPLQYYHGSGHPSKEWVSKVERRVHSFSETDIKAVDSKATQLINRARTAHPLAASDGEALSLYVYDRAQQDFNQLDLENDQEDAMIDQLQVRDDAMNKRIQELESQIDDLMQKIQQHGTIKEEASGVIATKAQARDPRYSMSLTQDVRPGAVEKNLRAFNLLAPKKK
jgi:phosphopantetheine adenylyltransferase